MPDSPSSEPESDFVCACEEWMRSACHGDALYEHAHGKRFCLLHLPSQDKQLLFERAVEHKLENRDFNFRGVYFPGKTSLVEKEFDARVDFTHAIFSGDADFSRTRFTVDANFHHAEFKGKAEFFDTIFNASVYFHRVQFQAIAFFVHTTFSQYAHFSGSTFRQGDFGTAVFEVNSNFNSATFIDDADFVGVTFRGRVSFGRTAFSAADFSLATFCAESDFSSARFASSLELRSAIFKDTVKFSGERINRVFTSSLDLQFAKIEKPDDVSFHTVRLHPHWFINIDARRCDFTNIDWNNIGRAKPELDFLKMKAITSPHRLLAIASRRLAAKAEENDLYRDASHFRRMAFDAERLETWHGFDIRRLNWWYWIASGYGERPFQALVVLVGILVLFGALYTQVGFAQWEPKLATEADVATAKKDEVGAPLRWSRALTYSAGVLTFQRPEPKPATTAAQGIVLLETILGPVQAALLALAIRRKFMR